MKTWLATLAVVLLILLLGMCIAFKIAAVVLRPVPRCLVYRVRRKVRALRAKKSSK